jgi:hypothetical protein
MAEQIRRREFIKTAGASAVASLVSSRRILGANDRIRFGLIGCGSRGKEIFQAAMRSPNAEAVAAADVYTRRLDEVKALAPSIRPYKDFRQLLDDKGVDAVLIATPQHQHALNFVPALQAGRKRRWRSARIMRSACGRRSKDRDAWSRSASR